MPILKLSDVEVGVVKNKRKWSQDGRNLVEVDPFDDFVENINKQRLPYVWDDISNRAAYHQNYMRYLEKCWAEHLGIVITPDIMWYTILCELVSIVKENSEKYRDLFSKEKEKQDITIPHGGIVMPLDMLVEELNNHVPVRSDLFIHEFTTSNNRSRYASYAAFCDMCSPYYEYSIQLCGFPLIDVRGTTDDYIKIGQSLKQISELFDSHQEWFTRVGTIISSCILNFTSPDWWIEMFNIQECGSGTQVLVSGWYSELCVNRPKRALLEDFPSCVSIVDYEQLNTKKHYRMMTGLFMSHVSGEFLVPDFGSIVFEQNQK